jgi:hypothetical protein
MCSAIALAHSPSGFDMHGRTLDASENAGFFIAL